MPLDKPNLDQDVLGVYGITYIEEVVLSVKDSEHDCGHVEVLREALLNFDQQFPRQLKKDFEREYHRWHQHSGFGDGANEEKFRQDRLPPESAYYDLQQISTRAIAKAIDSAADYIEEHARIARKACNYIANHVSDSDWILFMRTYVFKTFEEALSETTGYDSLLDHWSLEGDVHWNEAKKYAIFDPNIKRSTSPKPDLTYAFPITKADTSSLKGFERDECVENFSIEVLGELRSSKGLISSPVSALSSWTKNRNYDLKRSDLISFPWAVVEFKHSTVQKSPVQICYCQAANGASAALKFYESLSKIATGKINDHIPPVVAFTCVGPNVKVWLAYSLTKEIDFNRHKMVCIWEGTLESTWGVISVRLIIKNMHFWATRILRPKLSTHISQIRQAMYVLPRIHNNFPREDLGGNLSSAVASKRETKHGALPSRATNFLFKAGKTTPDSLQMDWKYDGLQKKTLERPASMSKHEGDSKEPQADTKLSNDSKQDSCESDNGKDMPEALRYHIYRICNHDPDWLRGAIWSERVNRESIATLVWSDGAQYSSTEYHGAKYRKRFYGPQNKFIPLSDLDQKIENARKQQQRQELKEFEDRFNDCSGNRSYAPSETSSNEDHKSSNGYHESSDEEHESSNEDYELSSDDSDYESLAADIKDKGEAILSEEDLLELEFQALQCLWGKEFLQLEPVRRMLDDFTGVDSKHSERWCLLDLAWDVTKAFIESPTSQYRNDIHTTLLKQFVHKLDVTLSTGEEDTESIHDALFPKTKELPEPAQSLTEEHWKLIDKGLQNLEAAGPHLLMDLLTDIIKCWDGKTCLHVLGVHLRRFDYVSEEAEGGLARQAMRILDKSGCY
ncbi:hypothetical protein MMC17_006299 [Xylographa soralifera]|nr:hypothetical protein [Xylographa soralifera]